MRKLFIAASLVFAVALAASPTLFARYEAVRQGLLSNSLENVHSSAKQLAADARKANQTAVAKQAEAVARSADLAKAREAFAALSDEMIQLRAKTAGARPAVYACPMLKKSWLQEKGTIGNPYDPAMRACGTLSEE